MRGTAEEFRFQVASMPIRLYREERSIAALFEHRTGEDEAAAE